MYICAQPYKCNKCGHEFKFSVDDPWDTPVIEEQEETDRGTLTHSLPVCPKCWETFIRSNLGLGYCTIDWGHGSHYNKVLKNETN